MRVVTGTPQTQTEHNTGLAATGVALSVGIPIVIALAGIATLGWGAISWSGALFWGAVASFVMFLVVRLARTMKLHRMDMLDLMGSMMARPHSGESHALGLGIHLVNGALLGVAWAYACNLLGVQTDWVSALGWSLLLFALFLMFLTSIGAVHPAIRDHRQEDPGPAARNFGRLTPLGVLLAYVVYGLVLGYGYWNWPLVG